MLYFCKAGAIQKKPAYDKKQNLQRTQDIKAGHAGGVLKKILPMLRFFTSSGKSFTCDLI